MQPKRSRSHLRGREPARPREFGRRLRVRDDDRLRCGECISARMSWAMSWTGTFSPSCTTGKTPVPPGH